VAGRPRPTHIRSPQTIGERKAYVDINVFVYWLGAHPEHGESALQRIRKMEAAPRGTYTTSALTLYQLPVIISGLTDRTLKDTVAAILEPVTNLPGLTIEPLRLEDTTDALSLMRTHGLDYEDALHLASAQRAGAKTIISNDQDFDKTPLKRTM